MSRAPRTTARPPRTTLSPLLVALLMATLGFLPAAAAAPGGSASVPPPATTSWVNLTLTDALAFTPADPSAPTLAVTFEVRNPGTTDHTFTISNRVNVTAPSGSTGDSTPGQWFDSAHVLADVNVTAGATVFVNVTFPTPGTYQFICRIHFPSMQGIVTVGLPPTTTSSPSYLLYGATGAIVLIVVVIATVWLLGRRKSAPAQPPAAPPTP